MEVEFFTIQSEAYDNDHNDKVLARDLNLFDERGENALIQMANYRKQLVKTYKQRVQHREFSIGDLILRKVVRNTKNLEDKKLIPNWEYNILASLNQF